MALNQKAIDKLNHMCPTAARVGLGTEVNKGVAGILDAGSVGTLEIEDLAVTLAKLGLVKEYTVKAAQAVSANHFVQLNSDETVQDAAAAAEFVLGAALEAAIAEATATVYVGGELDLEAQVDFPAGDPVKVGTGGAAINAACTANATVVTGTGANFGNQPTSDTVDVVSDSTDDTTQTVTIYGTNGSNELQIEELGPLTGTTPVTGSLTFNNVCGVIIDGECAGTVTVSENSGSLAITTITTGNLSSGVLEPTSPRGSAMNLVLNISTENTEYVYIIGTDVAGDPQSEVVAGSASADVTANAYATITQFMVGDCAATARALTVTADAERVVAGIATEAATAAANSAVLLR